MQEIIEDVHGKRDLFRSTLHSTFASLAQISQWFHLPTVSQLFVVTTAMVWVVHSVALVLAQPDLRLIPKSALDDRTGSLEFE